MTAGSPQVLAARLIRADIRKAVNDGALGELPDGISFSVRAYPFATSPGVGITVYGAPGGWRGTGECDALIAALAGIGRRHWNPPAPGFTDVQVRGGGPLPGPRPVDDLDLIEAETAQITPEHIEERLQETLRRAGYGRARGDIPGRPRRQS